MKLLLDANLSWRLIPKLLEYFPESTHVEAFSGTKVLTDREIWEYSKKNGYIIVTNDEDFVSLLDFHGFPPKVLLLKTNNQSNSYIEALLLKHREEISKLGITPDYGLLEVC